LDVTRFFDYMKMLLFYKRSFLTLLVVVAVTFSSLGISRVIAANDVGYKDFLYTGATAPTGQKPQSKLWFADGIWWGVLFNKSTANFEIYRLNWATQSWSTTGTTVDIRRKSSADALWDGSKLYTVSAVPPGSGGDAGIAVMRFSYNSTSKLYSVDNGFPVILSASEIETVVMDKDSTGMLWVTFTDTYGSGRRVLVTHSTTSELAWVTPYTVQSTGATTLKSDDISTLVAYNGKIGILWSNQNDGTVYFASHTDGTADNVWVQNPALSGPSYADDHLNIKSLQADSSGQVYAAVKTSLNDVNPSTSSLPEILLLELDNHGSWSRRTVARISDNHTRPIVLLDVENRDAYVFMTYQYGTQTSGAIYYKKASLDDKGLQFPTGLGTPFIEYSTDTHINNISSTKQPLNGTTNLVAIAGDDNSRYYFHNVIDLPTSGPTATPTSTLPPTNTPLPTDTPTPMNTSVPPTATPIGAPLFADGFESGDFSNWTEIVNNLDAVSNVESTTVYNGFYAAEFIALGTKKSHTYIRRDFGVPQTEITATGYFMVVGEGPKNANIPIFRFFDPSGLRIISLYRQNSSGLVRISDERTTTDTSGTMPLNKWTKFQLHLIAAGSGASSLQVYMGDIEILNTNTATVNITGIGSLQLGNDTSSQSYDFFADDIVVTGPGSQATSTPTATVVPTATTVSATATYTSTPTATSSIPTATYTATQTATTVSATATYASTPTATSSIPTATYTATPTATTVSASATPTSTPTGGNLFDDGFESGDFSAWSLVTAGGDGIAVVQDITVNSGAFSALLAETSNSGSTAFARKNLYVATTNLTVTGYFMITQEGSSNANIPLFRLFNSSGARIFSLYRQNLNGDQVWVSDSSARYLTSGLLPMNIWTKVGLHVVTTGSGTSTIEIYINDALVFTTTSANLDASGILAAQVGNETSRQVFTLFVDDISIAQ